MSARDYRISSMDKKGFVTLVCYFCGVVELPLAVFMP